MKRSLERYLCHSRCRVWIQTEKRSGQRRYYPTSSVTPWIVCVLTHVDKLPKLWLPMALSVCVADSNLRFVSSWLAVLATGWPSSQRGCRDYLPSYRLPTSQDGKYSIPVERLKVAGIRTSRNESTVDGNLGSMY